MVKKSLLGDLYLALAIKIAPSGYPHASFAHPTIKPIAYQLYSVNGNTNPVPTTFGTGPIITPMAKP